MVEYRNNIYVYNNIRFKPITLPHLKKFNLYYRAPLYIFLLQKNTHIQVTQVQTQTHCKTELHSDTHTVEKSPPHPVCLRHRYSIQLFSFNYFHNKFCASTYNLNLQKSGFPFMSPFLYNTKNYPLYNHLQHQECLFKCVSTGIK